MPSEIQIDTFECPFNFATIEGVDVECTRKLINDIDGEIVISVSLKSIGENEINFDVTLTGFKTQFSNNVEQAKFAKYEFTKWIYTPIKYADLNIFETSTKMKIDENFIKSFNIPIKNISKNRRKSIFYTLKLIEKTTGKKAKFEIKFIFQFGKATETLAYYIYSRDVIDVSIEDEYKYLKKLFVDNKIKTNIKYAETTLPSHAKIDISKKPFYDPRDTNNNIKYEFTIIGTDDEKGIVKLKVEIFDSTSKSCVFYVDLFGFMTKQEFIYKEINSYKESLNYPIPSWHNTKILDSFIGRRWLVGPVADLLGVQYEWIHPSWLNQNITLRFAVVSTTPSKIYGSAYKIQVNICYEQICDFHEFILISSGYIYSNEI